jgi:hypothetical protein
LYREIVEPTIADMRFEQSEALKANDRTQARFAVFRGRIALISIGFRMVLKFFAKLAVFWKISS